MSKLVFSFPLPPNLANSRMPWAKKHRLRQEFYSLCDMKQMIRDFPAPPKQRIEKASIRATVYAWNKGDTGNCMNRMKWIEDWLVTRGYLVDDSEKHLTWEAFPKQIIDRKQKRVEITISPLTPE